MIIDISKHSEYIHGKLGPNPFSRSIYPLDILKASTGLDVCFITNSSRCQISFTVNHLVNVVPFIGRVLMNGINYVVYDYYHNIMALECSPPQISNDAKSFVNIYNNPKKQYLEYHFHLPHFNVPSSFYIEIDDDCSITPVINKTSILFLGGGTVMGRGATFSTSTYSKIIATKLRSDTINLGVNGGFYYKGLVESAIEKCSPNFIIAELIDNFTTYNMVNLSLKQYITSISKCNVPVVFIEPTFNNLAENFLETQKLAEEIFLELKPIFTAPVFLIKSSTILKGYTIEQASISQYIINDVGHYCIANRINELIEVL